MVDDSLRKILKKEKTKTDFNKFENSNLTPNIRGYSKELLSSSLRNQQIIYQLNKDKERLAKAKENNIK